MGKIKLTKEELIKELGTLGIIFVGNIILALGIKRYNQYRFTISDIKKYKNKKQHRAWLVLSTVHNLHKEIYEK